MARPKAKFNGYIFRRDETWMYRLKFRDDEGDHDLQRKANSKEGAKRELKKLIQKFEKSGAAAVLVGDKMTFRHLAQYCIKEHYTAAEYDAEGRKLHGVRSDKKAHSAIGQLVKFFGDFKLEDITAGSLTSYRKYRLRQTVTRIDRATGERIQVPLSIATVNRELSKMRKILNIARAQKWLIENPFDHIAAGSLITIADERQRELILTHEQEENLLRVTDTPKRAHLHALLVAAFTTGARFGELIGLKWSDVDLDQRIMIVTSYKAKTVQRRPLYIIDKLLIELLKLKAEKPKAAFRPRKNGKAADGELGFRNNLECQLRLGIRTSRSGLACLEIARHQTHGRHAPGKRKNAVSRSRQDSRTRKRIDYLSLRKHNAGHGATRWSGVGIALRAGGDRRDHGKRGGQLAQVARGSLGVVRSVLPIGTHQRKPKNTLGRTPRAKNQRPACFRNARIEVNPIV